MLRNRRDASGRAGEVYIRLALPPPLSPLGHEVAARRAGETPALWQHHRSSEARISNQRRDLSTLWRNGVTDNRESRLSNGDFQMRRMSALGRLLSFTNANFWFGERPLVGESRHSSKEFTCSGRPSLNAASAYKPPFDSQTSDRLLSTQRIRHLF